MSLKSKIVTLAAMGVASNEAKKLGLNSTLAAIGAGIATQKAFKAGDERRELQRRVTELEEKTRTDKYSPSSMLRSHDYDDYEPTYERRYEEPEEPEEPKQFLKLVGKYLVAVLPSEYDTGLITKDDERLIAEAFVVQVIEESSRWEFNRWFTPLIKKVEPGEKGTVIQNGDIVVQGSEVDPLQAAIKVANKIAAHIEAESNFDTETALASSLFTRIDAMEEEEEDAAIVVDGKEETATKNPKVGS